MTLALIRKKTCNIVRTHYVERDVDVRTFPVAFARRSSNVAFHLLAADLVVRETILEVADLLQDQRSAYRPVLVPL